MGILLEKINESLKSGKGIADNFKNNSLFFYEKYQKSDNEVQSTRVQDIQIGRFYFFHYMDDSNWIKYSPVFTIGQKKVRKSNYIIFNQPKYDTDTSES